MHNHSKKPQSSAQSKEQTANGFMSSTPPAEEQSSSATPQGERHPCPLSCPNRQTRTRRTVVGGGYIFALIVAALLGIQSLDASYKRVNGEEDFNFATKSPPSVILIIGLTLIGLGLGIEIDKTTIASSTKELINGFVDSSSNE
ncbi:MAG TPA: hypothetical protein V6D11_32700 [Waterburya sp.]|jgi:hypothetical protein